MKILLIKLLVLPRGMALIACLSAIAILFLHFVPVQATTQADSERDEFPGGRQGGGTHWSQPSEVV